MSSGNLREIDGKLVYSIESRKSLELGLADLSIDGRIEIFPHVEEKGLLFIQFRRNRLVVSAGPYVGLIPLTPRISIEVLPKLPVTNLARVLDAARRSLTSIEGMNRLYLTNELAGTSIIEFLAANLLDAMRPIAANGLHKEYVRRSEMTSHPRGRIELAATLREWSRGQFHKVSAQRFEQRSDIAMNRLIKAALLLVLQRIRLASSQGSRDLVRRANDAYYELPSAIGPLRSSDYDACDTILRSQKLPVSRSYYYRALEISLLILSNRGIALQEHGEDVLLDTFIINFEDLFEEYLRRVLQSRALPECVVRDGNLEGKKPLFDDHHEPPAQPDITVAWRPTNTQIIAEVKYKEKPDRADINQAITYALSYRTSRAVLVHQRKPGSPVGLRSIGTIDGIKIDAYAFDLGADDIEAEEKAFCECIFELVRPPHIANAAA